MSSSRAASAAGRISGPTAATKLAAELEQQGIGDGADRWIVHVLGVHDDGHHVWLQIAPNEDGTQSLVLRLSMAATARHVLTTLATISRSSFGRSAIVPVMCTT